MNLTIRKAGVEDTKAYIALLLEVKGSMSEPTWFYVDPEELIRQMMSDGTMELWVAEDGNRLAGAFSVVHPGMGEDNLGRELNFDEAQLLRVVHMDSAAVHPNYRGLKLQKRLMETAEEYLGKDRRILLCTIHPDNRFSLQNVLNQGYRIEKKLEKYDSVRYILRKDL
jgi:ribosomal protein S18 acetylase RimI-like enzyme